MVFIRIMYNMHERNPDKILKGINFVFFQLLKACVQNYSYEISKDSSHTSFYVQVQYNSLSSYTKHFFIHRFYSYIEQLYCNFLTYRVKVKHDRTQNVLLKTNRKADIPCFTKSRIVTPPPSPKQNTFLFQ